MTLPCYSIAGVTAPAGGASIAAAVGVAPNTVTAPTLGFYTVEPLLNTEAGTSGVAYNHTWHKFTATQTGPLIFDALLSYPSTGVEDQSNVNPTARIELYRSNVGANPTSGADLTHLTNIWVDSTYFPRKRGRNSFTVTAGTTYVIGLWSPSLTAGSCYFVFRLSAYGAVTPYVQGGDEAWVLRNPWTGFNGVNSIHTDSLVPKTYYSDGSLKGTNQPADGAHTFGGFIGGDEMDQSFAGPPPAGEVDAIQCSWRWARTGQWGGQWWSAYPDGAGGHTQSSWNGTDPYNFAIEGFGTCLPRDGNQQYYSAGGISSPVGGVGVWWSGSGDTDGHNSTNFFSFGDEQTLWVREALGQFHADAGRGTPTDGIGMVEWEAATPTLLGVDASPDQTASRSTYENDGHVGIDPDPLAVQWYIKAVGYTSADQNPSNTWGPNVYTSGGYQTPGWVGGTGLPAFPGDQDMQLPDMTGRSGGIDDISWKPIPDAVLAEALAYEDAWQAQWDSGIGLSNISWWVGALRAVALYPEMFSDTLPPLDYAGWSYGTSHRSNRYRTFQCVAWRMRLRPARHRWRSAPLVPTVELCDLAELRIQPRDDAVNAGTAYRTFPPQKAERVHGGYPG